MQSDDNTQMQMKSCTSFWFKIYSAQNTDRVKKKLIQKLANLDTTVQNGDFVRNVKLMGLHTNSPNKARYHGHDVTEIPNDVASQGKIYMDYDTLDLIKEMIGNALLAKCVANFSTKTRSIGSKSKNIQGQTARIKKFNPFKPRYQVPVQESIIFGIHPVFEALERHCRKLHRLFVKKSAPDEDDRKVLEIRNKALGIGLPIQEVAVDVLRLLAHGRPHQGVCLDAGPLPVHSLPEYEDMPAQNQPPLWLLLDRVQDPMNLGAVMRTSMYLGVDRFLMVKKNSCKLSAIVSKASSGAMENLDIYMVTHLLQFLEKLKCMQWAILGSGNDGSNLQRKPTNVWDYTVTRPTVLIIGNEGTGISNEIFPYCDEILTIPPGKQHITSRVESLNVSVATGILLSNLLASRCTSRKT